MSIVDAIQRAKQIGMERRATDRLRGPDVAPPAPAHQQQYSSPVSPSVSPPVERAFVERVEFAHLPYDPSVCAENRIIVPDVEPRLLKLASPPYRMLRARILQQCRTHRWSSLAITSPGPGEGKSVTSLNLAISIAREGSHDVFLLDLDMRNPSLCRYLGVAPKRDVVSYFNGDAEAQEIFFTAGIDRLTLAGSRNSVANASELLSSDRLEALFAFIRRVAPNPLILVDLPPVASTDDALVVAPRVNATVLIVSEGITRREGLQHAVNLLSDFPLAGVILNQSHESIGSDYYGGIRE